MSRYVIRSRRSRSNGLAAARAVTAVALLCLVGGCTIQLSCKIYNNSGATIKIVKFRDGAVERRIDLKDDTSIFLKDWAFWSYYVVREGERWRYVPREPDMSFVISTGFGPWTKRFFKAQIQPDGRIYLLKPNQYFPQDNFVEQPVGFPLKPAVE